MDYAHTYFGKPLTELEFADIERFFVEERQESDQIEFKSYNPNGPLEAKLSGLIEGITAFLNSSGGLLIWGAPEGRKVEGRKEKAFVGNLTKLPLSIEKDWLISKIADKIIPLPRGFRVQLATVADGQIAIFEVDESAYAPHQTSDKYYMRIDGQNKPAPHHYIEALFKKVSFPRLQAHIKVIRGNIEGNGFFLRVAFMFFNFSPLLNEEKLFYRIIAVGGRFARSSDDNETGRASAYGMNMYEYSTLNIRPSIDLPLYHSQPERNELAFYFPTSELSKINYIAKIIIVFGGKAAPIKSCSYNLNFNQTANGMPFVTIDHENELMSDRQRARGQDEVATLEGIGVVKKT